MTAKRRSFSLEQEGLKCHLQNRVSISGKHTATKPPMDGLSIRREEGKELQIPGGWSELSSQHSKCCTI